MVRRVALDDYVVETLMPDLVAHDRSPSSFVVYVKLWHDSGGWASAAGEPFDPGGGDGSVQILGPGGASAPAKTGLSGDKKRRGDRCPGPHRARALATLSRNCLGRRNPR